MVGLPDGEKNFEDMYNRLDSIPACDRQTDILPRHSRATHKHRAVKTTTVGYVKPERHGQTDRQNCYIKIARQYADAR